MGRGFDAAPYTAMLHVAARNYATMQKLNRADMESYTEWKVMSEIRRIIVGELSYMSREQFGAVMKHMSAEYYEGIEEDDE